jgi:hypothetical protein
MVEAAAIVGEAEIVIEFSERSRGWFRVSVFEDLRAEGAGPRFFARAIEKENPQIQALGTGDTPEEAAATCLRGAGVSLRRAS